MAVQDVKALITQVLDNQTSLSLPTKELNLSSPDYDIFAFINLYRGSAHSQLV